MVKDPGGLSSPFGLLREAVRAVPAVKYALGVAGVLAAVAIAQSLLSSIPIVALLPIALLAIFAMGVLLIFSSAAGLPVRHRQSIALTFLWAICVFSIVTIALTLTSVAFSWPVDLRKMLFPAASGNPADPPTANPVQSQAASDAAEQTFAVDATGNPIDPEESGIRKEPPDQVQSLKGDDGSLPVTISEELFAGQEYERIRLRINDVEVANFELKGDIRSQTKTIRAKPGDFYTLSGTTRYIEDGEAKTIQFGGSGRFKSPIASRYYFKQADDEPNEIFLARVK